MNDNLNKISFDLIKDSTFGACKIDEVDGGLFFHRFTDEQENIWKSYSEKLFLKSQCPSLVRLEFKTDSTGLRIEINTTKGTTDDYFSLEVYSNGLNVGHIKNRENDVYGEYSKDFCLPEGLKTIRIDFPWSCIMILKGVYIDKDSTFKLVSKKKHKVIFLGDSITQGYMSQNASFTYPSIVTDSLPNTEGFNKGLGAAVFDERLGVCVDNIEPDIVFTMYGTNNFAHTTSEDFHKNCPLFFKNLKVSYPKAELYCIVPIWRKDWQMETPCGEWLKLCEDIVKYAEPYGYKIIRGDKLFPKIPELMGDFRLHPNDRGFAILAGIVLSELRNQSKKLMEEW